MKNSFKRLAAILGFALFVGAPVFAVVAPSVSYAAPAKTCNQHFLTFPTWFRGLVDPATCEIVSPNDPSLGKAMNNDRLSNFIWHIVLNIIEIALQLVAYLAVFFIIYGGFQFLTNGANPSGIEKARTTLLNAVIGLAIALGAVGLVNLIVTVIG